MVELLEADLEDCEFQVEVTKGVHARFSFLRKEFWSHLLAPSTDEVEGDGDVMQLDRFGKARKSDMAEFGVYIG